MGNYDVIITQIQWNRRFAYKNQACLFSMVPLSIKLFLSPASHYFHSLLTLSNPTAIFWMASSFPFFLTGPKSYCSFIHRQQSVNSILQGTSASLGNTALDIINPRRSEGKITLPNPARPAWDNCCLVTVPHWLECAATGLSKIPHSLWHFLWL